MERSEVFYEGLRIRVSISRKRSILMRHFLTVLILVAGIPVYLACATGGSGDGNSSGNSNTVMTRSAVPANSSMLKPIETTAFEAWKNKNGTFFEDFLTAGFVTFGPEGRMDKAAAIKDIAGSQCMVEGFSIGEESATLMGSDGAVFTFKGTTEGTCAGDKIPSPFWAATVYIRDGDKWKAAYHNEVPTPDAKPSSASGSEPNGAGSRTTSVESPDTPETTIDTFTQGLIAVEKKGWEGRKSHDLRAIAEVTMLDLVYIDADGTGRYDRDEAAKVWTGQQCSIKSFSLREPLGRPIGANSAILTYKASIDGKCGNGSAGNIWGTTVYMKEGGVWKALLIFNRPA